MSENKGAIGAGLFADIRTDGDIENRSTSGFLDSEQDSATQPQKVDARTAHDWNTAFTRWAECGDFRRMIVDVARREIAAGRHFTFAFLAELARREYKLGRDCPEFKMNNSLQPAYARLLIMDVPKAARYMEFRQSRFDACASGNFIISDVVDDG